MKLIKIKVKIWKIRKFQSLHQTTSGNIPNRQKVKERARNGIIKEIAIVNRNAIIFLWWDRKYTWILESWIYSKLNKYLKECYNKTSVFKKQHDKNLNMTDGNVLKIIIRTCEKLKMHFLWHDINGVTNIVSSRCDITIYWFYFCRIVSTAWM